ncbi:BrnA antitoxin family protein (plasmid) [Rhizobium indicum]|uniref:BrnA antitoxin family protein n=1 Tax=Rhizobium indicum TaxID=2583231 RepID=UPI00110647FA|nr:BrnA antitoxin family protein [Rhizobium indicum]QKK34222.1 BrnA antitoxin family protein [Rhizobium indicum]
MTRIADSVMKISDAEEAKIQRQIASDPDAPEATDEQLAKAKPFAEALPELAESIRKNLGGRPKSDNPKVAVSIRLDPEVVDAFKAKGEGWQSRINETLRKAVGL